MSKVDSAGDGTIGGPPKKIGQKDIQFCAGSCSGILYATGD
jgi:hypothetical protein